MNQRAVIVVALGIAVSYGVLQGCYRTADQRNAVELVAGYRPLDARRDLPSLGEFLIARDQGRGDQARWTAEVLSDCRGVVRVTGEIPHRGGLAVHRFDVDLSSRAIHPTDAQAKSALEAYAKAASIPAANREPRGK